MTHCPAAEPSADWRERKAPQSENTTKRVKPERHMLLSAWLKGLFSINDIVRNKHLRIVFTELLKAF